jgi:hypothetical protein
MSVPSTSFWHFGLPHAKNSPASLRSPQISDGQAAFAAAMQVSGWVLAMVWQAALTFLHIAAIGLHVPS